MGAKNGVRLPFLALSLGERSVRRLHPHDRIAPLTILGPKKPKPLLPQSHDEALRPGRIKYGALDGADRGRGNIARAIGGVKIV